MTSLGKLALILAVGTAAVAPVILWYANQDRKKHAAGLKTFYKSQLVLAGAITAATAVLILAFIVRDFSFEYVASNSSANMAVLYRLSALWSGAEGSLLLWVWMLSVMTAIIAYRKLGDPLSEDLSPTAVLILDLVQLFFVIVLLFALDPFKWNPNPTVTGQGMNPLLLHWAMILHPPTLFVGYAGLTIPFAYALAAMIKGDAGSLWVKLSQKWTIFTWLFLSIGIFLGALWAYVVLGWGGYWGWDPVENASMLPWFTSTALIHSFTAYRGRKTFKRWALAMSILSFFLVILATFITRTGVVQSVHTFEKNPAMNWLFGGAMAASLVVGFGLMIWRYKVYESENQFDSLLSKDMSYYLNNLLLLAFAVIVTLGTVGPAVAKLLAISPLGALSPALKATFNNWGTITVKADWYNNMARPLGIIYLALTVICPLLVWRKTDPAKFLRRLAVPSAVTAVAAFPLFIYWRSLENLKTVVAGAHRSQLIGYVGFLIATFAIASIAELFYNWTRHMAKTQNTNMADGLVQFFVRSRSKAAGYLTHLGIAVMMVGLIGSSIYAVDSRKTIPSKPGSSFKVGEYSFKYQDYKELEESGRQVYRVAFDVYDGAVAAGAVTPIGRVEPQISYYDLQKQETRQVDIRRELFKDVFVIFEGLDAKNKLVMHVFINPLISWVWIGSFLLVFGTAWSAWPIFRREAA